MVQIVKGVQRHRGETAPHPSATSIGGKTIPTGDIIGTSDTQTLSGKTLGGDLAAGGFKITGLGAPVNPNDAARKTDLPSAAHIEGKLTAGAAAAETVTWTTAFAANPAVTTSRLGVGALDEYAHVTARSTTGATVTNYSSLNAKLVIAVGVT